MEGKLGQIGYKLIEYRAEGEGKIQSNSRLLTMGTGVCVGVGVCLSCLTLCESMDYSPPGSSVHGVSQARILEWVAISFYRGSS